MTIDAIDKAESLSYSLVSLTSAEGDDLFLTDWDQDVTVDGTVYVSTPDLEIKLPINDGLLNEQDCRIAMPFTDDPDHLTHRMTTGEPHAEVTMEISEVNKDPVGSIPTVVTRPFIGKVVKARLNYEGQADVVLFQALSEKGIIATANQGVQANIQCSNSLGGRYCREGVDILDHTFSVTITAIDVGELTCTGVPTGKDDRYFEFGYVESQGLRLMVQGWRNAANGDESKVQLMRQAPARWVGRTVTLVAGCPKTVEICRSRFNNEENIRPFGYGIPSYDPQFEGNPTDG